MEVFSVNLRLTQLFPFLGVATSSPRLHGGGDDCALEVKNFQHIWGDGTKLIINLFYFFCWNKISRL